MENNFDLIPLSYEEMVDIDGGTSFAYDVGRGLRYGLMDALCGYGFMAGQMLLDCESGRWY